MTTLDENINRFSEYYYGAYYDIKDIQESKTSDDLKITLYLVLLDAISKSINPTTSDPRTRFVNFIKEFGNWSGGGNVSLPHLDGILKLYPSTEYCELQSVVRNRLNDWYFGQPVFLENDLSLQSIEDLWPRNDNGQLKKINGKMTPEYFQHYHLLYNYRNSLVHEFIRLGWKLEDLDEDELFKIDEPYYRRTTRNINSEISEIHWFLCYPPNWLENMCQNAIGILLYHFRNEQIDPSISYLSSDYFLDDLNV